MKLKDVTESAALWSTPTGCVEARADVADGVVVGPSGWGLSIIGVTVEYLDGKIFRLDQGAA